MLFWALLASGQISMRKVDGWQSLGQPPAKSMVDLAACRDTVIAPETATAVPTHPGTALRPRPHPLSQFPRQEEGLSG
jgi:hypothetical protein